MWRIVSHSSESNPISGMPVNRYMEVINKEGIFFHNGRTGLSRPAGFQHEAYIFD